MVDRIKEACADKKWSLATLEKQAGLKDRTVYRWDENTPSIDKVVKASLALGVSVDWLCGISDIKIPATKSDGLTGEELSIINRFLAAPKDVRSAILRLLRDAESDRTTPGAYEEDK